MLIKQNQLLGEATALLDNIDQLTLSESAFDPSMVNVRHNDRLQQDLIQLESFLGFAQCYGIEDAGLAIHRVCEANGVPRGNLGFVVNEENIIADDEIADTYAQLSEAGFPCHVARISSDNIYYTSLMEALELDQEYASYEDSINLQNYVNESVISDAKDKLSSGYETAKSKVKGGYDIARNKVSGAVSAVSAKLASVRKAIAAKAAEMKKLPASGKAMAARQLDKLKSAAKQLKAKLFDLKARAGKKVNAAVTSVKSTATNVGNTISKKAGEAKDAVSSGIDKLKGKFSSKEG